MKRLLLVWVGLALWITGTGNNVRIDGDVRVERDDVTGNIANVKIKLLWDNSWRDAFNYDAVYIFLKYKKDGNEELWHHAYLADAGHTVPGGFTWEMSKTSTTGVDQNQGIFIHRSRKAYGNATVDLELKWNIATNPDKVLDREMFTAGQVFISAMGIEMVYVPRGAFRIGDTDSDRTFYNKDITLPEANDLLGTVAVDTCFSSEYSAANPPQFATNRMNDVSNTISNAWVGRTNQANPDYYEYWQVRFKSAVAIRNIAIESISGRVPAVWSLQGNNGGGQWYDLYTGSAADWAIGSHRTYPCTRTLRINNSTPYVNYRIRIIDRGSSTSQVIKNIAMSDKDVFETMDNSILISGLSTKMSNRYGLYAHDADSTSGWSGNLNADYPNGYGAFYAMKYEITQEQYVAFLNKLTAVQQRARTTGAELESLPDGSYVFGPRKTTPSARNGIKLASIGNNDAPYVFANDLDPSTEYSQEGDGQTIACNYLNAGDMLAYADWCGLRPLTEMEYEKMGRRPYPFSAIRREYAWNTNANFMSAAALDALTVGRSTERSDNTNDNINAGNKLTGPMRAGAFSRSSSNRIGAGASFWGVMDLSGNLTEIYYNANVGGRLFRGMANNRHGNGKMAADGTTDVAPSIWPVTDNAFALRGGNFRQGEAVARISDRSRNASMFGSDGEVSTLKDSTLTFRLGRTAPVLTEVLELLLENGQTSALANAGDSICSGSDYVIEGAIPADVEGAYRVAWFMSSDEGATWDLLAGEENAFLKLSNLRNINTPNDTFKRYWYKRMIYSSQADYTTNPVIISVINKTQSIDRLRDTVDIYNYSQGIRVQVPQQTEFKWTWLRENDDNIAIDVEYKVTPGKVDRHFFKYTDFFVGSQYYGDQKVLLEVTVMKKCNTVDTVRVFVEPSPVKRNNVLNDAGKTVNPEFECGDILVDNEEAMAQHKEYRTIEINGRCWFADNLNRETSNFFSQSSYQMQKCYNNLQDNCRIYGRLYNFYAATQTTNPGTSDTEGVQGICPKGWHLPTNTDWASLFSETINASVNVVNGSSLKNTLNEWTDFAPETNIGSNLTRFSAMPGGGYFYTAAATIVGTYASINTRGTTNFYDLGLRGWWWTSSTSGNVNTYWNNTNTSMTYMPFYIRMDSDGRTFFTLNSAASGIATITNTIFRSTSNSYTFLAAANSAAGAILATKRDFYFSVRCIRN